MEHKEKVKGEFNKWIGDLCRECSHPRLFHLVEYESASFKSVSKFMPPEYMMSNCSWLTEKGPFCSCEEFVPPDNLDYIELLAKRKGLIKDE